MFDIHIGCERNAVDMMMIHSWFRATVPVSAVTVCPSLSQNIFTRFGVPA